MTAIEIEGWIIERLAYLLEVPSERLDSDTRLDEIGLDSMSVVTLSVELEHAIRRRIRPETLAEYPTVRGLAEHLAEQ